MNDQRSTLPSAWIFLGDRMLHHLLGPLVANAGPVRAFLRVLEVVCSLQGLAKRDWAA